MLVDHTIRSSIGQSIRNFIAENLLFEEGELAIGDDESLTASGIVDSTGVLELLLFVEQTFGIDVDDSEVVPENFDSVSRLASLVCQKKGMG
jgi:acyl carrier protein